MPGFLAEVLTWPRNYYNAVAVETAVSMGLPPTSMLTDEQPTKLWTQVDKKLALAWTILQRETCSKCGQPLWICRSTNSDLVFKPKKDVCFSTQEYEKYTKSKNGQNLKPGEYIYTIPRMQSGEDTPLPSRADYYKQLAED